MCVSLSGWGRSRMHPDLPVGVGVSQRCKRCGYPFQVDDVGHHRLHPELTSPKPVKRGRKLRARVPEGETQLQLLGNGTTIPTTMATQNRTSSTRISKRVGTQRMRSSQESRSRRGCTHAFFQAGLDALEAAAILDWYLSPAEQDERPGQRTRGQCATRCAAPDACHHRSPTVRIPKSNALPLDHQACPATHDPGSNAVTTPGAVESPPGSGRPPKPGRRNRC